jgi:hypothetical protein
MMLPDANANLTLVASLLLVLTKYCNKTLNTEIGTRTPLSCSRSHSLKD